VNDVALVAFSVQTLTYAAPLLLAALGEVFTERAGVINIGLEGLMIAGAFAAVVAAIVTGSPWLGVGAALLAGSVLAGLFALFGIGLKRDQVIVGTTVNFLALGLTGVLFRAWSGASGTVSAAPTLPRVFGEGPTAVNAVTLLALALVPLAAWLLFRTRLGVTLRATGEMPEAAAAAGAFVNRLRAVTVIAAGALAGLAGADLAVGINNGFTENMTGGRGFIALAIVVFGRWRPLGVLGASLLFAAADVAQTQLQATPSVQAAVARLGVGDTYPLFLALPYLLTLVALAVRGGAGRAPAALGQPFEQG
jgi:simple sugar transport system permease protein